ncbi:N-acetyl-D-Glu racemase DgcA [Sediminicurvatus halobius]|uniref:Dipeptide epimerase n=1 Tax=Sediminicurvatus halobius TaxID=2182432 RepID=A0A2U2N485_9GAMM|nr:N-acetyl-D-Glu racemase DgcA [Spiribacter halobius]PWG63893.1 L-Ala-D/L-Glu epimerase [Spiribacter halobius]UEX76304.1 L-Ala-D/L-Glu epimerase [Spiribacter halobius]
MSRRRLEVHAERFPLRAAFTISRGSRTVQEVVRVAIHEHGHTGQGECVPYAHYGETVAGVVATLEGLREAVAEGLDRDALAGTLAAGAARNALDCALWDLAAKQSGRRVWELAGLAAPEPVITAYTLSLDTPAAMAASAAANAARPLLKIKLGGGDEDIERIHAVRDGAPEARLIVDANEGWDAAAYERLAPELARAGVAMIEQPLPAADDAALAELPRPVPLCADESCHDRTSLARIRGRYDLVNIKLDKAGGLTEALALREAARADGLGIMVGCMLATSLAMAPAVLLAQGAAYTDLDGPLLLAADREPGLRYDARGVHPPESTLWG